LYPRARMRSRSSSRTALVGHERHAQAARERLARHVVHRRAQPARDHEERRARRAPRNGVGDVPLVVTDDRPASDVHAAQREARVRSSRRSCPTGRRAAARSRPRSARPSRRVCRAGSSLRMRDMSAPDALAQAPRDPAALPLSPDRERLAEAHRDRARPREPARGGQERRRAGQSARARTAPPRTAARRSAPACASRSSGAPARRPRGRSHHLAAGERPLSAALSPRGVAASLLHGDVCMPR
jgi:hypothetical protein